MKRSRYRSPQQGFSKCIQSAIITMWYASCKSSVTILTHQYKSSVTKKKTKKKKKTHTQSDIQLYEPTHDKTNNVAVRPAKTQISLGIRPVCSESSLSAWKKKKKKNLGP